MRAGIALGSNIGDRVQNLRTARAEVIALQRSVEAALSSSIYETEPVDCETGTPPYLNAVVEIDYDGTPARLLDSLRSIEKSMGRPSRRPRNAPRTIDLDILYFGDLTVSDDDIVIPHPRMRARRFVLAPLMEIRPDLVLPGGRQSIARLFEELPEKPVVKLFPEKF